VRKEVSSKRGKLGMQKTNMGTSGDFTASCINCSLRGHTELECMCRNVKEGHPYAPAHIDLSKSFLMQYELS
jgi:hypothetical protein